MEQKLTAAIVGAYPGCKVNTPEGIVEVYAIHSDMIKVKSPIDGIDWYSYDDCQLILTPLNEISDEDAYYIGKTFGHSSIGEYGFTRVGRYWATEILVNDDPTNINFKATSIIAMSDFLRSRGYDCGYGPIKSLIQSGIAIKKQ